LISPNKLIALTSLMGQQKAESKANLLHFCDKGKRQGQKCFH